VFSSIVLIFVEVDLSRPNGHAIGVPCPYKAMASAPVIFDNDRAPFGDLEGKCGTRC